MSRLLYAQGARGPAVTAIQAALRMAELDGDYGPATAGCVAAFQHKAGLQPSGQTDNETWEQLLHRPIPSLFERCLAVTASFEGHGYTLAQGNFDGAGITWGLLGFTLRSGSLAKVIEAAQANESGVVNRTFGELAPVLCSALGLPVAEQIAWADTLTEGVGLVEPWRTAFARLGAEPAARHAQETVARSLYFDPATQSANTLALNDELGVALCFDIHVQNGGPRSRTRQALAASPTQGSDRRELLARLTAASAYPAWQADVLARKLTFTHGQGQVHGQPYDLSAWGIGDHPAGTVLDQAGPKSG